MCGICGVVNYNESFGLDSLKTMSSTLVHRGPDDEGTYFNEKKRVALGHRRLSILDLDLGHQPMANEDYSIYIVFNGEIYNYRELRRDLSRKHVFRTFSDTEVLLHLYEEYGAGMLDKINGMFAFGIWDNNKNRLLLARDRLGIKPLYYTQAKRSFIFASEIKAILKYEDVQKEIGMNALYYFLQLRCVPSPYTMFKNIYKIEPGCFMEIDLEGSISNKAYWRLEDTYTKDANDPSSESKSHIDSLLSESVHMRMISDVPIGAFLSGGIDSSLIVSYMRKQMSQPVDTFTVGFDDDRFNEFNYAREVSEYLSTTQHEVMLDHKKFFDCMGLLIHHFDDPVADGAIIPMYYISKLAKENNVKVMLSGEGSDELFAGYSSYLSYLTLHNLSKFTDFLPNGMVMMMLKQLMKYRYKTEALGKLYQFIASNKQYTGHSAFHIHDLLLLFNEDYRKQIDMGLLNRHIEAPKRHHRDFLDQMLYFDLKVRIPDDLLARLDKLTMAASIEGRVPFLDHRLVEAAMNIPGRLKIHGDERKYIIKEVARDYLPNRIIYRKKRGFPVPIDMWVKEDLKPLFKEVLLNEETGIFDKKNLTKIIAENETGRSNHSSLIWRLFYFTVWEKYWIKDEMLLAPYLKQ
ncbi:MAG: asparagine synthase (glutamine-hydrolyzing) [Nitrospiria bacterium]